MSLGLSSAEQAVQEATEVHAPDWAHSIGRVYLAFEQQGTQLTSLQSLEASCSAAIPALGWETHLFLTMILNSSRHLIQQGKEIKVKKNSVFLLLLIFGQLAYHHQLSVPQFLTMTGTKVMYDQPQKYSET